MEVRRVFDETNPNWGTHSRNMAFINSMFSWMGDLLLAKGHVFLNEVYGHLGFPLTAEGQVNGWTKKIDYELIPLDDNRIEIVLRVEGNILDSLQAGW